MTGAVVFAEPAAAAMVLFIVAAFITLWIGDRSRRDCLYWGLGFGVIPLPGLWLAGEGGPAPSTAGLFGALLCGLAGALLAYAGTLHYVARRSPALLALLAGASALAVIALGASAGLKVGFALYDLMLLVVFLRIAQLLASGGPGERLAALLFALRGLNGAVLTTLIDGYSLQDRFVLNQVIAAGSGVALLCAGFLSSIRELDSSRRLMGLVNGLVLAISGRVEGRDSLSEAMEPLRERSGAMAVMLFRHDATQGVVSLRAAAGAGAGLQALLREFAAGGELLAAVLQGRRARLLRAGIDDGPLQRQTRHALLDLGVRSGLLVPVAHAGAATGFLLLLFREDRRISASERAAYESIGQSLGLALSNGEQLERARRQAQVDVLSGLPNRLALTAAFDKRLEADGAWFGAALLLVDIDRFKEINDTLGHAAGDRLLVGIARRLEQLLPERERTVAHLGGDSFAVLLFGRQAGDGAVSDAEGLLARLREPVAIEGMSISVDATVGIALAPLHAQALDALLRFAEVAMYHAKQVGASVTVYGPELDPNTRERLALMNSLKRALPQRELALQFQPKIALANGEVTGVEALIRWQHPELGLVAPTRFMPMAEVSPLIHQLTAWVADQSLAQLGSWGRRERPLSIALNVSVRNLLHANWYLDLIERVQRSGVDPALLELEITEGVLMHDPGEVRNRLERLATAGIRLSIDDFGTGYSSLSYLQKLPIHTLKIDRSFVAGAHGDAQKLRIAEAVVNMAKGLGLAVVAEGIESTEDHAQMRALGCDHGQGYLYAPAMKASELEIWLAGWRHRRRELGLGPELGLVRGSTDS